MELIYLFKIQTGVILTPLIHDKESIESIKSIKSVIYLTKILL